MTRRTRIPPEVIEAQRAAADPGASVWVEANAGSGKTHVLTQRVLRLLLSGVSPDEVLCLTYTKAAAAEMRQRIAGRLGDWALLPDDRLRAALSDMTGALPAPRELTRARTLFAHALDTPGGLRIQTIHAFCESVLHRFPVEAGIPFDFTVLEDHQREAMILRAREAVLAGGLAGGAEAGPVRTLFAEMSDFAIGGAIDDALGKARTLRQILADRPAAKARLRRLVGDGGDDAEALQRAIETETLLRAGDRAELVRLLAGRPTGRRFVDMLARADLERPSCDQLLAAFLTGEGEPRATLMSAAERRLHPDLNARFEAERDRIHALATRLKRARLVARAEALLDVLAAIMARYDADKRARSLLDFDDLVERTAALFRSEEQGLWVRFKLDARITHILVDESQDTNEEQWQVVRLLAEDFFDNAAAASRPRTIFAVGDGKQSIYSFQGANPKLFNITGDDLALRAGHVQMRFERRDLTTSFRTLPAVLAAVDLVFDDPARHAAVLARQPVRHFTARAEGGGLVVLWPPVQVAGQAPDPDNWPLEAPDSLQSAPRQVAMRIAREIRGWIDGGRLLAARGRPVRADDVLILVQSRAALFHEIIRALLDQRLPTPGADRLAVTTHIAVLDLLALGDVLLNSADDLQLAALLRSPLFDVSEEDLHALAHARPSGQTLWQALRDRAPEGGAAMAAYQMLADWRSRLDFERPYEFYAQILYAGGGLRRFHSRFGTEVDDLFAEFLDLALAHEQAANPSLQGFLAEMRARDVTIKRELGAAGGGVRVMTVHGAKGLEAPIVILADAASKPMAGQLARSVIVDAERGVLFHSSRKTDVPGTAELRQAAELSAREEYWRKLYVGMTRAEDELYVTGALTPGSKRETQLEGSWYDAIESSLRPHAEIETDIGGAETAILYPGRPVPAAAKGQAIADPPAAPAPAPLVPPALPRHAPVVVVRPSSAFEPAGEAERVLATAAEASRDADSARREGLALHALLQHLGRIAPPDREAVAGKALAALLPDAADRHAALARKALSILGRPEHAELFGPDSRAELPFLVPALRRGEKVTLAGRIDRLVVTPDRVLVVDFKSDAAPPEGADAVPAAYLTQLGLYALVAGQLFPGREVRAAILWTSPESLVNLPPELLAEAASAFTMR